MELITGITIYTLLAIIVFVFLIWDSTRVRDIRLGELPEYLFLSALWPFVLIVIILGFIVVVIDERVAGVGEKVIFPSRKKPTDER